MQTRSLEKYSGERDASRVRVTFSFHPYSLLPYLSSNLSGKVEGAAELLRQLELWEYGYV